MKKHIFLSVTERCNLNCIYCFEKSKRREVISLDTAMKVIEQEMTSPTSEKLNIDLMGGEPFVEFERVKQICETVWARDWPIPYQFTATTNGTFVHGKIKEWLIEHSNQITLFLSIDGIKKAHDMNRSNSFSSIDIDFFRTYWPDSKAKTVCSKQSIDYLAESIEYICEWGFPEIDLKLAYSFNWNDREMMDRLQKQYAILVDYFVEHPEYRPPSLLEIDMKELNFKGKKIKKWCTCGEETVSYDMDGMVFPCRYYQDLVRFKKVKYEEIWKEDYYAIQDSLKGKCRKCLIRDLCRTCYAYNMDACGDYGLKNSYSCALSRISAYYSALLAIKRSEMDSSKYEKAYIEAAKQVVAAYDSNCWEIEDL